MNGIFTFKTFKMYTFSPVLFSINDFNIKHKYMHFPHKHYGDQNLLGGDCSGLGGDKRRGDLGGLNKPHTVSNSSVILVYSVCICINNADRPDGGITLIFGSVNVTLRSIVCDCNAVVDADAGGSLVSG